MSPSSKAEKKENNIRQSAEPEAATILLIWDFNSSLHLFKSSYIYLFLNKLNNKDKFSFEEQDCMS